jgi:predicted outer membrane protein
MTNRPKTWDDLIKNAEVKHGKDSSIAKFWRETKEKALKNKGQRFEELYYDRPIALHKDDK